MGQANKYADICYKKVVCETNASKLECILQHVPRKFFKLSRDASVIHLVSIPVLFLDL